MAGIILCGIGLAVAGILVNRFVRKMDGGGLKYIILSTLPSALFVVVTYAIFTPSALFLENISDFSLPYISVVPVILAAAFLLCTVMLFWCCAWEAKRILFFLIVFSLSLHWACMCRVIF